MQNPLADIHQYSNAMTISQAVKFCEKKGLNLTRAMIQNYIRHGLVPPPVSKRFYTHKHLAALVLINYMKTVFDMDTIKENFCPLMDDEGLPLDVYNGIIKKWAELTAQWKKYVAKRVEDTDVSKLALMVHAAALTSSAARPRRDGQT